MPGEVSAGSPFGPENCAVMQKRSESWSEQQGWKSQGLCRTPFLVGPLVHGNASAVLDQFRLAIDMAADLQAMSLTVVVGGVIPGGYSITES